MNAASLCRRVVVIGLPVVLAFVAGTLSGPAIAETFPSLAVVDVRQTISSKSGALKQTFGMASPEAWLEDFGSGQLVAGSATVTLDDDFANAVVTQGYHVFVTPLGDSAGLYVATTTPASFTVREQGGGKASVGFSYRVVGKRKDLNGKRFETVQLPPGFDGKQTPQAPSAPTPPNLPAPTTISPLTSIAPASP